MIRAGTVAIMFQNQSYHYMELSQTKSKSWLGHEHIMNSVRSNISNIPRQLLI